MEVQEFHHHTAVLPRALVAMVHLVEEEEVEDMGLVEVEEVEDMGLVEGEGDSKVVPRFPDKTARVFQSKCRGNRERGNKD